MSTHDEPGASGAQQPFAVHLPPHDGDPLDLYRRQDRPSHDTRPWVLSNFVAGIDGAIAIDGRVDGLSSPADQEVFDLLRSLADVVLVGAGTFRAERYPPVRLSPGLRAEREARGQAPVPRLAVVSRSLQLDWDRPSFTAAEVPAVIVTSEASDPGARARAAGAGEVVVAGEDHVDPRGALEALHARGDRVVLCEGGTSLMAELLAHELLDELCLTVSPLVGGDPSRIVADEPRPPLTRFRLAQVLTAGDELYLRYLLRDDGAAWPAGG